MVRQLCLIGITLREHGQPRPSTASVPSWRPAPPRPSTNGPKWRPPPPRPSTAVEALGGRRRPTSARLRQPTKAPDPPVGTDGFGFFDQQPKSVIRYDAITARTLNVWCEASQKKQNPTTQHPCPHGPHTPHAYPRRAARLCFYFFFCARGSAAPSGAGLKKARARAPGLACPPRQGLSCVS